MAYSQPFLHRNLCHAATEFCDIEEWVIAKAAVAFRLTQDGAFDTAGRYGFHTAGAGERQNTVIAGCAVCLLQHGQEQCFVITGVEAVA